VSERWSKPATIYDAVEGDTLVQMPSGETMVQANVSVDEETLQRMFTGYICMNCLEPQEEPFPEVCEALKLPDGTPVGCGYRMRERQHWDLLHKYGSLEEVQIGSRIKPSDELERLREMDAYEERTGIVLPPSVKFPNSTSEGKRRG
jgi:hypothetical protein